MHPRFQRYRLCRPVTFSGEYLFGEGIVTNITHRGCRVRCNNRGVPDASCLTLRLSLPRREASLKVAEAVVRWSRGRECGLEFLRIQPAEQDRLRGFLSTLTEGAVGCHV